ncbi:MAG: radical SAM protein [Dehalococcoidales bacterium]|nr:MAG: radical SAM protein [Dehalococcoidales bacterium]
MTRNKFKDAKQILSREEVTITKDWGGRLPIALIYPNSYYLGMSNLGIHAIYRLLNNYGDVVCERVFWEKGQKTPPIGLESGRPLTDFAVLAFSVTYELDYFNVIHILRTSGIPSYATERDERHPLIIAGGACITANPMPLSPFFDCLCIGEAEAILPPMLPVLSEGIGSSRHELLKALAKLPGVYVPQQHTGTPVVRQWVANLDDFPTTSTVLTPDTELGNLYLIEVERGCGWGCNFCLVSNAFRPVRYRSVDGLLAEAEKGLHYRKRLGLVGPAVTDHPQIDELVKRLRQMGAELSVSSLRIKPLSPVVLAEVAGGGARTIALAPEAGSERLRRLIAKRITEDDILKAVATVVGQGIKQLKLYFMIGLPSENDYDIEEIIRLTFACKGLLDKQLGGGRITLSISPFIPKAGTPFQWLPMAPLSTLEHRLTLLRNELHPKGIQVKAESLVWTQVQAVLARGDSRLSEVLASIEAVSLPAWRRAITESRLDIDFYAHQQWDTSYKLPWAWIDSDVSTGHHKRELERALVMMGASS